jgi:cytochrome c-type biogenesis protein CcmH/NrfG
MINDCEPESLEEIQTAIQRDSYDPNLQYVHYVRFGDRLFNEGNVDAALDAYRVARSLHDDRPELIQKCIECVSLIAPEAEAIPDYLVLAEKYLTKHDLMNARNAYDQVRMIDPFNHDARQGLETVTAIEKQSAMARRPETAPLGTAVRQKSRRVGLNDLLIACQDAAAAADGTDEKKLSDTRGATRK